MFEFEKGIIYLIFFPGTSEQYVGQTKYPLEVRNAQHLANRTTPVEKKMNIMEYDSMVIEECYIGELNERESYFIDLFSTNIKDGFGGLNVQVPSRRMTRKIANAIKEKKYYFKCPTCGKRVEKKKIVQNEDGFWFVDCECGGHGKFNSPYGVKYQNLDAFIEILENYKSIDLDSTYYLSELEKIERKIATVHYDCIDYYYTDHAYMYKHDEYRHIFAASKDRRHFDAKGLEKDALIILFEQRKELVDKLLRCRPDLFESSINDIAREKSWSSIKSSFKRIGIVANCCVQGGPQ